MIKKLALSAALVMGAAAAAEACPGNLRELKTVDGVSKKLGGKTTCILEGKYVSQKDSNGNMIALELDPGFSYILNGNVFVGVEERVDDVSQNYPLTSPIKTGAMKIKAGVTIYGLNPKDDLTGVWDGILPNKDSESTDTTIDKLDNKDIKPFLAVTRDSSLKIEGTANDPVLMTSAQGVWENAKAGNAKKAPGDWGGLILNGYGRTNLCFQNFDDCNAPGEAGTGWYGGNDDTHNSGFIQYLQIEFGGDQITDKKQYNGLTLNGVGIDTTLENIAILHNNDDSIEFFGGAAIVKNLLAYKQTDDGLDTTEGARIFFQNGVVVAADFDPGNDPNNPLKNDRFIIEADSSDDGQKTAALRAHSATLNFTFIGANNSQGFRFRRGTNYTVENSIMWGFDLKCWAPHSSAANLVELNSNEFSGCNGTDESAISALGVNQFLTSAFDVNSITPWELNTPVYGAKVHDDGFQFLPEAETFEEAYVIDKMDFAYDDYETDEGDYPKGYVGGLEWVNIVEL